MASAKAAVSVENCVMSKSQNLSDYIADDLMQRLLAREVNEEDLTLGELGRRYGVSFTPIRRAIDKLVERRLLLRQENGRVGINVATIDEAQAAENEQKKVVRPLDSKAWDSMLSQEVIRLSLLGEEEFLREESTALKYGIGRTALRQILHRLSGMGLITHFPRRGWKVRPFEPKDLDDFLAVREVLECQAMDLCREQVVRKDLQEMLEGNVSEAEGRLDDRLHDYFISRSGNRYIIDFFERNAAYYTVVLNLAAPETKRVSEMAAQHRQVLEHALNAEWDNAKEAMRDHIRAQRPIVLEMIDALQSSVAK